MTGRSVSLNGRREALLIALAAAEACWVAPVLLALFQGTNPHVPLLLWLGALVLLSGFCYIYRALEAANLSLGRQQGLLVVALVLSVVLFLRFHVYGNAGLGGLGWLVALFRSLTDVTTAMPTAWIAVVALIYLWSRGIHLARRSLSAESVGFSFRGGVVLLIAVAFLVHLYADMDVSEFVILYFFFSLGAVALARIESVSRVPGSTQVGFSGFWVASTVGAVSLLMLLGMIVAVFFYGGGLRQVLHWLSPLLVVVQVIIAVVGMLVILVVDLIFSLFSLDLSALTAGLQQVFDRLGNAMAPPALPPGDEGEKGLAILGALQASIMIVIPIIIIALVILATWYRSYRAQSGEGSESRESLLTAGAVGRSLRALLQAGRDRLGELAGLVDRFGLGSQLLSAISIRRIYANLVRLATKQGYPRVQAQTPNEYLETLYEALPGNEEDVALITKAYVDSHYGQVPDSRQELERIRECWQRVQTQQAKTREQGPS